MLLIDNLDGIISHLKNKVTSKLMEVFRSQPRPLIIATCTSSSIIDDRLLVKFRLGQVIQLQYPSKRGRSQLITEFLSTVSLLEEDGSLMNSEERRVLIDSLTAYSQGHSFERIYSSMANALAMYQVRHRMDKKTMSASDICLALQSLPSPVLSESVYVSGLITHIDKMPEIVNLEGTLSSILRSVQVGDQGLRTSGLLICGPSGCGKTSLARRVAFECSLTHKYLEVACAELVHKIVGESERKLVEIFRIGDY